MDKIKQHLSKYSRRAFLGAGAIAAGALVLRGLPGHAGNRGSGEQETAGWQPMPYVKLDVQMTRERAYNGYYQWHS